LLAESWKTAVVGAQRAGPEESGELRAKEAEELVEPDVQELETELVVPHTLEREVDHELEGTD
jgi:hypothetical protein